MIDRNNKEGNAHVRAERAGIGGVILFGLICCLLYGLGAGVRCNVGILVNPLIVQYGVAYDQIAFSIAVMQLVFGASQPLFGLLAAKHSNRFVLALGAILLTVGVIGIRTSRAYPLLVLFLGIVFGAGAGAISFGMVLSSAIHFAGQKNAMLLSGMLNAAAGLLGFVLAPLIQTLIGTFGLGTTLVVLAVMMVLLLPIVYVVTIRDPRKAGTEREEELAAKRDGKEMELPSAAERMSKETKSTCTTELPSAAEHMGKAEAKTFSAKQILSEALNNRTYRLLIAGFGTCGFHMVIIESHLFSQFVQYGISRTSASGAFSVYSLATITGALLSGYLSGRMHKGRLLGIYYGFRAVWTIVFLFVMPKNMISVVVFAIGLGLTGDATVSPTSGLVNKNFRLEYIATLIGLLFLCHQIGAFLSAWLGGILFAATGGYTAIWMIDVGLCSFAALMSFRIRE